MISGTLRISITAPNPVVVAIPRDKTANTILDRGLGPETDVAHQIPDIREGFHDISGLHRQHFLDRRSAQFLLQERHDVDKISRFVIADIVEPRWNGPGLAVASLRNVIDQPLYNTGNVID